MKAFPNPAGSQTIIEYTLAKTASVRLEIFDASGRLVKVLASGKMGKGKYQSVFRTPVAGLYTYRLSLDKEMKTGRVMIGQ